MSEQSDAEMHRFLQDYRAQIILLAILLLFVIGFGLGFKAGVSYAMEGVTF